MQQHDSKYFVGRHTFNPKCGVKRSKYFFISESSYAAYKKGMEHRAPCKHIHTLNPGGGVKGQNISFSEGSHVAYQVKGKGA